MSCVHGFHAPPTLSRSIWAYSEYLSDRDMAYLRAVSRDLARVAILHINTAAASGGVAEMLRTQIPLERSLGLDSHWLVMRGPESYFEITKKIHHGLQGADAPIEHEEICAYLHHAYALAPEFQKIVRSLGQAIVVLHDPQPLPLIQYIPSHIPVTVRIHPDLSTPNDSTLALLRPFIQRADRLMVSDARYRPRWFPRDRTDVVFPAIDPLSRKNKPLSPRTARKILSIAGIDMTRPLISQVSRIDPWKDPLGVIEAYAEAKREVPEIQLAIVGINLRGKRSRDEEKLFAAVEKVSAGDPDIHLFGEKEPPAGISNDMFVNAIQSASTIVLQKSLREGFGMSLTEAMFKGAVVIGGRSAGISHQIDDGKNGYIVGSVKECARRIVELLSDEKLRDCFKNAARESARARFLMPRLVTEHLLAYRVLTRTEPQRAGVRIRTMRTAVSA